MRMLLLGLTLLISSLSLAALPQVVFETNMGKFTIELNAEKAPVSVENFLKYVDSGFYTGTIFHRLVKNFVIQGGGHLPDMTEKETLAPIINEAKNGLSNVQGSLGLARTEDINSATSQFYVNLKDNLFLDHVSETKYGYAVFGQVIEGLDFILGLQNLSVISIGEYDDVPATPIVVTAVTRK